MKPSLILTLCVAFALVACGKSERRGNDPDGSTNDGGRDGATDGGLVDGSSDAEVDDDAGIAPVPLDWSCLGPFTVRMPTTETAEIYARAQDYVAGVGIANAVIKACAQEDADCETPVAMGTTDTFGVLTMTLPLGDVGFFGFFETSLEGYLPTIVHTGLPIIESNDEAAPVAAPMITQQQINFLGLATGIGVDAVNKGIVGLGAIDCEKTFAHHVKFTISPSGNGEELYYIKNNLPNLTATHTDGSGFGVFVNVPPGDVTVSAVRSDTGEAIGSAVVHVRAGTLSELYVAPTPDGVAFDPEP